MTGSSYDEGYNKALEDVVKYITDLKNYYAKGIMCSMAESIHGENVCEDILKHLKDMRGEK